MSQPRSTALFVAVARALAVAIAPILAWRSARRRRSREAQRRAQAQLTEHLDNLLQRSQLAQQIELADHRLRIRSPLLSPRLRSSKPTRRLRALSPISEPAVVPLSPSSPEASPPDRSLRLDHRVVLCPRADGRLLASCECGWTCSAGSRQQTFDDLDTHLSVVIAMYERDDRRPPETN